MARSDFEPQADVDSRPRIEFGFWRTFKRFAWQAIRLPFLVFLMLVEPVVRFVMVAVALLGIVAAFFFEFLGTDPRFPFWLVFGLSLGCGALVILLNAVTRHLAR